VNSPLKWWLHESRNLETGKGSSATLMRPL
jgi:hypothetical protein